MLGITRDRIEVELEVELDFGVPDTCFLDSNLLHSSTFTFYFIRPGIESRSYRNNVPFRVVQATLNLA